MFKIMKCRKCNAEFWLHGLEGSLVIEDDRILVNDGNHLVDLVGFIDSLGIKQDQSIGIYIEKREDKNK